MEFLEYTKNTTFLFQLSVEQIAEATGLTTESYHTVGLTASSRKGLRSTSGRFACEEHRGRKEDSCQITSSKPSGDKVSRNVKVIVK